MKEQAPRTRIPLLVIASLILAGFLALAVLAQSNSLPGFYAIGDGMATVITFIDLDLDGVRDVAEPGLPGVCIRPSYNSELPDDFAEQDPCQHDEFYLTDAQGRWGDFLPGGDCADLYVFAIPPEGFQSTNSPVTTSCSAEFGFADESIAIDRSFLTAEEFTSRRRTLAVASYWGAILAILGLAAVGGWALNRRDRDKPSKQGSEH